MVSDNFDSLRGVVLPDGKLLKFPLGEGTPGLFVQIGADGQLQYSQVAITTTAVCDEANIQAGSYIYINSSGNGIRANGPTGKPAVGFVLADYTSGQTMLIYCPGAVNTELSGFSPSQMLYLGVNGAATHDPDSTSEGAVIQELGMAKTATSSIFTPAIKAYVN